MTRFQKSCAEVKKKNLEGAAPQPPALGGEIETLAVIDRSLDGGVILTVNGSTCGLDDIELVDRAHVARLQAEVERSQGSGPVCFCGLKQTKNPHPEAGVPPDYVDVGTVYDCIPCLNKSRRAWSKRANKAEGEVKQLKARNAELEGLLREILLTPVKDHVRRKIDAALTEGE